MTMQRRSKLISMQEAANLIRDGQRIAFGGFAVYQRPMAFVHELIRAKKRNLHIIGIVNSIEADMLIGAGCVASIETSYVGLEKFGLAQNYRRAAENGEIKVTHYPEMISWDRFRANAEGLNFWPVSYLGGSDIVNRNPKIKEFRNPMDGSRMFAVPAADPDMAIIHVPVADIYGNAQIQRRHMLPQSANFAVARSTKNLIVTAEQIVSTEEIARNPHLTHVPAFRVKAVVHAPFGAHPTSVLDVSGLDGNFFYMYSANSLERGTFAGFLDTYIFSQTDHRSYCAWIRENHGLFN
jgi:glutaconate CoA-transferase subunit A